MGIEKPKKVKVPIAKMSAKKKAAAPKEKASKDVLKAFYNEMLNIMPYDCQNCGKELFSSTVINPRTVVAHVLAKSKYHSVATNIQNVVFLCCDCHNRFDMQTERFLKESNISKLIRERVQLLLPILSTAEASKVPAYLL